MIPILIVIVLTAMELGFYCAKHGQPHKYPYNAWTAIIQVVIWFGLLWWGGFFKPIGF